MLYLIGLGLADAKDISVKGLEVVKNAKEVYLEAYTSILTVGKDELVMYGSISNINLHSPPSLAYLWRLTPGHLRGSKKLHPPHLFCGWEFDVGGEVESEL